MNNERYNQIIDEAYKNYAHSHWTPPSNPKGKLLSDQLWSVIPMQHNKESFIHEIKTNPKFSKKWGLKIEERELSFKERRDLAHEYAVSHNKLPLCIDAYGHKGIPKYHEVINKTGWNIPIKLITVTYKDEKIEVYE